MSKQRMAGCLLTIGLVAGPVCAQTAPAAAAKAPAASPTQAPLRLQSLTPSAIADPFPAVDAKNFTADQPSVATVDQYLQAILGYDPNRIWRVEGIQKTAAPGVSKVTALVSERAPNAKVLNAIFYVLPDGKHLVAEGSGVSLFGANPYADNAAMLQARADGPARGSATKELLLVEFSDLQCPHCKEAQPILTRLAQDFPMARIVYQNYPLTEIHPFAFKAAAYGVCIAKASKEAFFTYAQAVYDTQAGLTPGTGDATLKAAATKAGQDASAIDSCAATPAVKDQVNASIRLGRDLEINQTPVLAVNGRIVPLTAVPYETLRQIVAFQASLDGVKGLSGPGLNSRPTQP